MSSISVIVVGDIPDVDWSLSGLGLDESIEIQIEKAATTDDALESIAVTNHEMDEIWAMVEDGTSINIYP